MENHIDKLSSRNLSLIGKAIILNTLILGKTANTVEQKTTLFLLKKRGGINVKEPDIHNIAMWIKHLLNLKHKENPSPWTYLATYWLAKDIYKFGKEYNYLKSDNRIKPINQKTPFYYNELIQYIKTQSSTIPKTKAITKILYNNVLEKVSKDHVIYGETQWKSKLINLQFSKIWNNIYYSYGPPHTSDLLFRLMHYATETNQHIYNCCGNKKNLPQTVTIVTYWKTIFTTCNRIKKLTNKNHSPDQHILTLSSNVKNNICKKLITTLTQVITYEIWQSRNHLKYDKIQLPQDTILNKVNYQLKSIIKTHYKYHKIHDTLDTFRELFCINNALAKLEGNKLRIML